LALFEMFVGI